MRKIVSLIVAFCVLAGLFPASFAVEYTYEEPVEPNRWKEPDFSTDHAYSIAFVGDPQFINNSDTILGTNKMEQLFGTIAATAEERKLKHVFVLGDITHVGYRNDANLAAAHVDPPSTAEWENAQKAILQLSDAGISYSLCRGNHDDYMMDDYFNIPAYTDQFKGCGGFFSDSTAKHPRSREKKNPENYVYWSALTGYHENSIVNSYKTAEICGNKYIFITVDFNPTMRVVNWLNGILEEYSDHMAIVTTHAYINSSGLLLTENDGTMYDLGVSATQLWNSALKLHENVMLVVSGHVGTTRPVVNARTGVNGNVVREILVDPQTYDVYRDVDGTPLAGVQDTGAVLYLNFSEDGGKVTFDYYSTLMDKEFANENYPLTLYKENPLKPKEKETSSEAEKDAVPASSEEKMQLQEQDGKVVVIALFVGSVTVVAILAAVLIVRKKKRKQS